MRGRKLMAAALLSAMVSVPILIADSSVLSDSELGEVIAQGFQVGAVNTNNDSVQINSGSQNNIDTMIVSNEASSAVNSAQNIANSCRSGNSDSLYQQNDQTAKNHESGSQFGRTNTNNGSVQINNAQQYANSMILSNSASSAKNIGQNIHHGFCSTEGEITQENIQVAENYTRYSQIGRKNLNNGSVQINKAQNDQDVMILSNSASSAVNEAQNISHLKCADSATLSQNNDQYAENWTGKSQNGRNNTNNGSVQLNSSQTDINTMILTNSANSAVNVGQNISTAKCSWIWGGIYQTNTQVAKEY